MSNSCFEKNSALWILREEELKADLPVLPDLMSAATGVGDQLLDVIRQPAFTSALIQAIKRELISLLATQRGKVQFTGMILKGQEEKRKKIAENLLLCQDKFVALEHIVENMPPYISVKTNFNDFEDKYKKLVIEAAKRGDRARDQLDQLVSDGFISQEDADLVRVNLPGSAAKSSIYARQTINELRERYYTVDRGVGVNSKKTPSKPGGYKIVDNRGIDIVDFYGSSPTIDTVKIDENNPNDFEIIPVDGIEKKPARRPVIPNSDSVAQDFYFEIAACSALDLLDFISDIQASIRFSVNGIKACLIALKGVLVGSPIFTIGKIANTTLNNINSIKKDMNDFVSIVPNSSKRILSIGVSLNPNTNQISQENSSVNKTFCEKNKDLYCDIHYNLRGISENFNLELEALSFGFGQDGEDDSFLPDINFDLPNIIEKIDLFISGIVPDLDITMSATEKLKGDLCLFLSRKIKATPKSLGIALAALVALHLKIDQFSFDFGISISSDISALLDRIRAFGMGPAAQMLEDGDLEGFLGIESEEDATYAGQVSKCIDSAISEDLSVETSSRLSILSSASKTRAEREVAGAKIRNKMTGRIGQSSGSDTAIIVQQLGRTLL